MMLTFLIDQAQLLGCRIFKAALEKSGGFALFWSKLRALVTIFQIDSWETLIHACAFGIKTNAPELNTC